MKVIIVRQAETNDNASGGVAARTSEVLLNAEGVEQAQKLGDYLRDAKISHSYVSPQARAVHTASEILAHHHVLVEHREDLREMNMGELDGLPKDAVKELRKNAKEPWHLFKAEKGESYVELQARAVTFFHELMGKHKADDTVLLVSHGGTLGVLLLHILEKELTEENYQAHQSKNTEFTISEIFDDGAKKIHVLNGRQHLDE